MDKYEIIQQIGKGSYGSVYKIRKKIDAVTAINDLVNSHEQVNKLQQDSVGTNNSTDVAKLNEKTN